jgi:hypothetical protein
LFDQQTCALRSRLSFRCGIAFDVHQSVCKRDLNFDLFAPSRRDDCPFVTTLSPLTQLFDLGRFPGPCPSFVCHSR